MLRSLFLLLALFASVAVADDVKSEKGPKGDKPKGAEETPKTDKPKSAGWSLDVGKDVPTAFHPYHVSGPYIVRVRKEEDDVDTAFVNALKDKLPSKDEVIAPYLKKNSPERAKNTGRFHDPVSHHGLDPLLLLFVKEVKVSDALKDLLRRVDTVIEKNPNVRLAAAVVFISSELDEPMTDNSDDAREAFAKVLADTAAELKLQHVALCLNGRKGDLEKWQLEREEAETYVCVLENKYRIVAADAFTRDRLDAAKINAILGDLAKHFGAERR